MSAHFYVCSFVMSAIEHVKLIAIVAIAILFDLFRFDFVER